MHTVDFQRLANGLRVVSIHRPHLHRSVLTALVLVGARHETPRTNGISHFLEHMLFRGTERHPTAHALNEAIELLGGELSAATHSDYTRFTITARPNAMAEACRLLGAMMSHPTFSQLETERAIVREEILETLDDQQREADPDNLARRQVFGAHPLGFPIAGTLDNLARFTRSQLTQHLRANYHGAGMAVAICSPLSHRDAQRAIAAGFGGLPPGPATAWRVDPTPSQGRARIAVHEGAGSQTVLRLAFPTPGESHPRVACLDLLMRVIDDGMSSRLHRRICDELGLAYDVSAGAELFREVGVMDVASSVVHTNVPWLIDEVLTVLSDLAVHGPTARELDRARQRFLFDQENLDDDAHALVHLYAPPALWNDRVSFDHRARIVRAVRTSDVTRMARAVFAPQRLNLTLVGALGERERSALRGVLRRHRERLGRADSIRRIMAPIARPRVAALDSVGSAP